MGIPNQEITVLDPGLGLVEASPDTPIVLGVSSLGDDNLLRTYARKTDVVSNFGQGPLPEAWCKALDIAGGPVRGMRLTKSVVPTFGSITTTRTSDSTGTIAVAITQKDAARAWQIDDPAGTPVFTEQTADFASATTADVDPLPAGAVTGDQFAIGYDQPFTSLEQIISTSGVGGTFAYSYYNGTAVVPLTGVSDLTVSYTAAPGTYLSTWTMPTDWVRQSLNSTELLYYAYAEVDTGPYGTDAVLSQGQINGHGAHDDYEVIVEILKTGTVATGTFRYSLDDGRSYSGEFVIPSAGDFDIPFADITITFTPGAGAIFFEDGDVFEFDVNAPYYAVVDLATAVTALLAQSLEFPFATLTGTPASAADGATMFAAVDGHATSFENINRYIAFIMDSGDDTTTATLSSYAAVSSRRVMPVYGTTDITSAKPFEGYSVPKRSAVELLGGWAADKLISTDLARVREGPVPGVLEISHDENLTEELDAGRITTLRTHTGRAGFFVTNGRIKAPSGSDFRFWQFRRIMDVACRRVFIEQQNFLNISVRTNSDGTIDERDALRLESIVNEALKIELTQPANAEGTRGHVSEVNYSIDRTNNINQSSTLISTVAIRPLGYAKTIETTIGFALEVAEAA